MQQPSSSQALVDRQPCKRLFQWKTNNNNDVGVDVGGGKENNGAVWLGSTLQRAEQRLHRTEEQLDKSLELFFRKASSSAVAAGAAVTTTTATSSLRRSDSFTSFQSAGLDMFQQDFVKAEMEFQEKQKQKEQKQQQRTQIQQLQQPEIEPFGMLDAFQIQEPSDFAGGRDEATIDKSIAVCAPQSRRVGVTTASSNGSIRSGWMSAFSTSVGGGNSVAEVAQSPPSNITVRLRNNVDSTVRQTLEQAQEDLNRQLEFLLRLNQQTTSDVASVQSLMTDFSDGVEGLRRDLAEADANFPPYRGSHSLDDDPQVLANLENALWELDAARAEHEQESGGAAASSNAVVDAAATFARVLDFWKRQSHNKNLLLYHQRHQHQHHLQQHDAHRHFHHHLDEEKEEENEMDFQSLASSEEMIEFFSDCARGRRGFSSFRDADHLSMVSGRTFICHEQGDDDEIASLLSFDSMACLKETSSVPSPPPGTEWLEISSSRPSSPVGWQEEGEVVSTPPRNIRPRYHNCCSDEFGDNSPPTSNYSTPTKRPPSSTASPLVRLQGIAAAVAAMATHGLGDNVDGVNIWEEIPVGSMISHQTSDGDDSISNSSRGGSAVLKTTAAKSFTRSFAGESLLAQKKLRLARKARKQQRRRAWFSLIMLLTLTALVGGYAGFCEPVTSTLGLSVNTWCCYGVPSEWRTATRAIDAVDRLASAASQHTEQWRMLSDSQSSAGEQTESLLSHNITRQGTNSASEYIARESVQQVNPSQRHGSESTGQTRAYLQKQNWTSLIFPKEWRKTRKVVVVDRSNLSGTGITVSSASREESLVKVPAEKKKPLTKANPVREKKLNQTATPTGQGNSAVRRPNAKRNTRNLVLEAVRPSRDETTDTPRCFTRAPVHTDPRDSTTTKPPVISIPTAEPVRVTAQEKPLARQWNSTNRVQIRRNTRMLVADRRVRAKAPSSSNASTTTAQGRKSTTKDAEMNRRPWESILKIWGRRFHWSFVSPLRLIDKRGCHATPREDFAKKWRPSGCHVSFSNQAAISCQHLLASANPSYVDLEELMLVCSV